MGKEERNTSPSIPKRRLKIFPPSLLLMMLLLLRLWQVEKTRELTGEAKSQASKVETQAREVTNVARGAAQASERQQAAFVEANAMAKDVKTAGETAKAAFRCGVWVCSSECVRVVGCFGVPSSGVRLLCFSLSFLFDRCVFPAVPLSLSFSRFFTLLPFLSSLLIPLNPSAPLICSSTPCKRTLLSR